ncbi:MAG: MerR family transcriptional regulator [Cetobacterium sp.]
MNFSIGETAKLTGVTIQTLRHYGELPHPNRGWGFVGSILAT